MIVAIFNLQLFYREWLRAFEGLLFILWDTFMIPMQVFDFEKGNLADSGDFSMSTCLQYIRCKQKCTNSFQHLCKYQTAGTYAEQLTQKRLDVHGGKGIVIRNVAKQIYGHWGTVYDQQGSGESMSSNESDSFCRILVRLAWQLAFIDIKPPAECNGSV